MTTNNPQGAKSTVRDFHRVFDAAPESDLADVLADHTTPDYLWRGMHPFYEQHGAAAVASTFWLPLRNSFSPVQRREDVFMAGRNVIDEGESIWVASMGHLMGLFDNDWIGIPATRKLTLPASSRYFAMQNSIAWRAARLQSLHSSVTFPA